MREQIGGEQRGLVAAGAGPDFQDRRLRSSAGSLGSRRAGISRSKRGLALELGQLLLRQLAHLGVGEHRLGLGARMLGARAARPIPSDDRRAPTAPRDPRRVVAKRWRSSGADRPAVQHVCREDSSRRARIAPRRWYEAFICHEARYRPRASRATSSPRPPGRGPAPARHLGQLGIAQDQTAVRVPQPVGPLHPRPGSPR